MPNVTFSVYTSDKINDTKDGNITVYHCSDYLGDYTTDSNGELLIQNIDRNKQMYFLVEKSIPNNYEADYYMPDRYEIEYKGKRMKASLKVRNNFSIYNANPSGSISIDAGTPIDDKGGIWDTLLKDNNKSTKTFYEGNFFGDCTVTVPIVNYLDLPRNWEIT